MKLSFWNSAAKSASPQVVGAGTPGSLPGSNTIIAGPSAPTVSNAQASAAFDKQYPSTSSQPAAPLTELEKASKAVTEAKPLFAESLQHPSVITARLILKCAQEQNAVIATKAQLAELKAIFDEEKRLHQTMGDNAHTSDTYRRIVAEDQKLAGKPGHQGLTIHDSDKLITIVNSYLGLLKTERRATNAKATPVLVAIGMNIKTVLEKALLATLEEEMIAALDWGIGFAPSLLVITVDSALDSVRRELNALAMPGVSHNNGDDAFFGVIRQLISNSK